MKRYRVVVTEIEDVTEMTTEYQVVADSGNPRDGGRVYEYLPVEKRRSREREILDQTVDTLNVPRLIIAVNDLAVT